MHTLRRRPRHQRKSIRPLHLEPLEARQLLSAAVSSTWTINGTEGPDNIVVNYNGATGAFDYFLNNVLMQSRPASGVKRLVINGGAGDDVITVSGSRAVSATIDGGAGNDTINGGIVNNIIYGGAGDDTITGGPGNDLIYGGAGNDIINGGAGNDVIYGGAGNDTIDGGAGNDVIYGDAGNDFLQGGAGNDRIYGESGNDTLLGGPGFDTLSGGAGADVVYCVKGVDANRPDPHDSVVNRQDIPAIHLTLPPSYQAAPGAGSAITLGTGGTAAITLVLQTGLGATEPVSGVLTLNSGTFQLSNTATATTFAGALDTTGVQTLLSLGTRSIALTDAGAGNFLLSNVSAAPTLQNVPPLPSTYVPPSLGNGTLTLVNNTTGGIAWPPIIITYPSPITIQTPAGTLDFAGPLPQWPINPTTIKITLSGSALQGAAWTADAGNVLEFTAAAGAHASVTLTDGQMAQFNQVGAGAITSLAITNPVMVGTTLEGNGQIVFAASPSP